MLYVFGFEKLCVAISDLFFLDPAPDPGQGDGPERGVRLEIRLLELGASEGSIYAARPINIGRALWRGDLLETVDGPYGSFDRTHQHLAFKGWEPGHRMYDGALSDDPLGFLTKALSDPQSLLVHAEFEPNDIGEGDFEALRASVPEIMDVIDRTLKRIFAGELAVAPTGEITHARIGWL